MNNRNTRLGIFFFLIMMISFFADSIGYTTVNTPNEIDLSAEPGVASFVSMVSAFFRITTFQIADMPFFVSLLVIIIVIWMILDLISLVKGLLPFTSGE